MTMFLHTISAVDAQPGDRVRVMSGRPPYGPYATVEGVLWARPSDGATMLGVWEWSTMLEGAAEVVVVRPSSTPVGDRTFQDVWSGNPDTDKAWRR